MKKILITGGTGSFGNAVVDIYLKKNNFKKIFILSRDENKQHHMNLKYNSRKLEFIIGDVRDFDQLKDKIKDIDVVFHAAALKHVPINELNPLEAIKTNILGTNNVIKACKANNIKKLILLSTDKAVYPINTMGLSKAIAEKLILNESYKNSTLISIVRYGNVLNSRGSVVETFIKQLIDKKCKNLTLTDERMTRFLLPLNDAVNLVNLAEQSKIYGQIYIKKAPSAKIIDVAKACMQLLKIKKKIKYIGIRLGEKLHETLISSEESIFVKEYSNHFIIQNKKNLRGSDYLYPEKKFTNKMFTYSSDNQKMLDIKGIIKLLKKDKYIANILESYKKS
tara:strand:- start:1795 stop:2805 length:1011 start_codon:yes stop_codon:yes gene_type:complete